MTGRLSAEIYGVEDNTAVLIFNKARELIADNPVAEAPDLMAGEIEV